MSDAVLILDEYQTEYGVMQKGCCDWCDGRPYIKKTDGDFYRCRMCNQTGILYRLLKKDAAEDGK